MWDDVAMPYGLDAVVDTIANGEAIYVTDGSYNRKVRKDLCSAGWLIYSTKREKIVMSVTFCEGSSDAAGSYRGELLGLLAIHAFIVAAEEFYGIGPGKRGVVACDNLSGLNKAKVRRKKVKP